MKIKIWLAILLVGLFIGTIIAGNSKIAYSYQREFNNYNLFYNDDLEKLQSDIEKYITDVDDYLISNSSFYWSDVLQENYDFLVNFACDYIINNRDVYQDKIVKLDEYQYVNFNSEIMSTYEYVEIEEIYDITYKYFGVRDFKIINDNVKIVNDYVSLVDFNNSVFEGEISNVSVEKNDDLLFATLKYGDGSEYLYTFRVDNNVLRISNIEVLA